ncbi:hypothetical protein [Cryobacterium sp. W22_MBD10_FK3]|uniref:hypothetical protein n=1 Tax=Cryobacterium sp. W22_MBD10_FK3 TaxID=3240273 RepID=UPI003F905328
MLLLAGCSGPRADAPVVNPTHSVGTTVSTAAPTPIPTPTPIAMDLADPGSWIIAFTGVGPLVIGDELSATDESMTAFSSGTVFDGCPSILSFDRPEFPGLVVADRSDNGLVELIALEGGATSSDYTATSPRTTDGIGIGATLDELKTAYPAIIYQDDHFTPHYALSDGDGNWINFAVFEGLVNKIVVRPAPDIPRELCG